jgi:hypothetical protein
MLTMDDCTRVSYVVATTFYQQGGNRNKEDIQSTTIKSANSINNNIKCEREREREKGYLYDIS